jgi:hypothetical protein
LYVFNKQALAVAWLVWFFGWLVWFGSVVGWFGSLVGWLSFAVMGFWAV